MNISPEQFNLLPEEEKQKLAEFTKDLTEKRNEVAIPMSVDVLRFLVSIPDLEKTLRIKDPKEQFDTWNEIMSKFIVTLRGKNLKTDHILHALKLAVTLVTKLQEVASDTFSEKYTYVTNKMWDDKYEDELTLDELEAKEAPLRLADYEEHMKTVDNSK